MTGSTPTWVQSPITSEETRFVEIEGRLVRDGRSGCRVIGWFATGVGAGGWQHLGNGQGYDRRRGPWRDGHSDEYAAEHSSDCDNRWSGILRTSQASRRSVRA